MSADPAATAAELRPSIRPIDLASRRSIHIVGIGGAGMRAIARILHTMGHRVSGSDAASSLHLDELEALGITVFAGHAAAQVEAVEMVARSTAVPDDNTEVAAARAAEIPVYTRAEILSAITSQRPGILVAGTHGKTTTASMLAVVLDHADRAPSFLIGAEVGYFATGARWQHSDEFVVEADESDGTFLALPGAHAIVTSLDPDHLEFYGSAERLEDSFIAFVDSIAGTVAVCRDDPDTQSLIGLAGVVTYGTDADADFRIDEIVINRDTTDFDLYAFGDRLGRLSVGLPGHHNALNAAGAAALALTLGVGFDQLAAGLTNFDGVARRFERRGEHLGVRFVDDYAHLPAEVETMVATATQGPWNRVIATYQPHRFSRTEALGATFATSFRGVDHLVLTDIYPSGEEPRHGVTGRIVYDAVTHACPELSVSWQPSLADVTNHLAATVGPGDLCLTLGAGDLTTVPDLVLDALRSRSTASADWLDALTPSLTNTHVSMNAPIGPHTTYRVGGAALALAQIGSADDLQAIVSGAAQHATPILVVGKGSNMLIADHGYDGIVIMLTGDFDTIDVEGTTVTLGAAVSLPAAARQLVSHSLTGFEWAVGVPGSIGGAIVMNAGGHGSDMAATVVHATVLDLVTGERNIRSADALDFGYRTSSIGASDLVLDATMELVAGEHAQSQALLSEIVRWRRENQPGGQNAGSVFTNPPADSAGRLIDAAGGKGLRVGSAVVSDKHANFIQADPNGKANDVYELMRQVIELVQQHSGIELEPETRLVGFDR